MNWPLVGRDAELEHAIGLVESNVGVAMLGPAGVGKSRLLHEVIERVGSTGANTVRVSATESLSTIPFAPFVELLPAAPTTDRTELLRLALEAIRERSGPRGLVLAVDDAHHLDAGSLALLVTVVSHDVATVCFTARTGEAMAADLVDLWTDGVIERMEVVPLVREHVEALLRARFGEVSAELVSELWRVGQGNPLVLHELIEGGAGRTIVRDASGAWGLRGALAESPRLADLVQARLELLPSDLRHATELVSVGAPLPLSILAKATDLDLSTLEDRLLVELTPHGNDALVAPAHPLYGEVLEANLSESRRRVAYGELVQAATHTDTEFDELRVAVWQRDSGSITRPELAVSGAMLALGRHDPGLAEELIRPVIDLESAAGAAAILGRALTYQGRYQEAEELLAGLEPSDGPAITEVACARAHNLAFGLGRAEEAVNVLQTAAASVDGDVLRGRLDVERGMVSAIRGDFADAKAAGRSVLANAAAPEAAKLAAYVSLILALAMAADCVGVDEIVDEALGVARMDGTDAPLAENQIAIMYFSSLGAAGRIREAVSLAAEYEGRAKKTAMESTWLDASVIGFDLTGRLRDGEEAARAALVLMAEFDPFGLELQARGLLALELAQTGDAKAARAVEGIEFGAPDPRLSIWVNRGRAWASAAAGDIDEAARLGAAGGSDAVQHQHITWGGPALHDVVRFGRPELVLGDLEALRSAPGAHLLGAMADHAEALHARDAAGLLDVASGFAAMGAVLLASEAAAQASLGLAGPNIARAACLSMIWESECQDPATPALAARPAVVSARELEVALGAAAGRTSPSIAEECFISVRTVDNHLRSVYRKLDVGGRDELREVFSPTVEDA